MIDRPKAPGNKIHQVGWFAVYITLFWEFSGVNNLIFINMIIYFILVVTHSDCGVTKGCFAYPYGCIATDSCLLLAAWKPRCDNAELGKKDTNTLQERDVVR